MVAEVHYSVDDIWAAGRNIRYRYLIATTKIYGSGNQVAFGSLGVSDAGHKPFKRLEEEGTLIASHNSKSEWHPAKVVRTTMQVVQGGAEVCRGNQKENMEEN